MRKRDPFAPFGITKASQLREKSNQWFDDTRFVYRAQRFGTALYLGGFVVECMLKAELWQRRSEEPIRRLLTRSHDLTELLGASARLWRQIQADSSGVFEQFVLLANWTVRFRYNPKRVPAEAARDFMARLVEVRQWLLCRI